MARLTRLEMPLLPHLVTQSVRPGDSLVHDIEDERALLKAMLEAARGQAVAVHAYVVLRHELHLLVTPSAAGCLSAFMQAVGRQYVAAYNRRHARQGGLWAGRYRCTVLDPAQYLLDAMMFIESHAWQWETHVSTPEAGQGACASLGHHLGRYTDPLVQDHAAFWALGNTPFEREAAWRQRLMQGQVPALTRQLAEAVRCGWPLGGPVFLASLAARGARRLAPKPRGRPRKTAANPQSGAPGNDVSLIK